MVKTRFAWGTIELILLAGIILFVVIALARCNREGVFKEPALDQCHGVEWTGIKTGTISDNSETPVTGLTKGYCTRVLFSSKSSVATISVGTYDNDPERGEQWTPLYQVLNPQDAEGWGGIANASELRIRSENYVAGKINYAVYQAKPKSKPKSK